MATGGALAARLRNGAAHARYLKGSGYLLKETRIFVPVDENGGVPGVGANSPGNSDLDMVARDSAFPTFAHVIAHGTAGSTCTFWGMIIQSS